jgi:hypothetical protein
MQPIAARLAIQLDHEVTVLRHDAPGLRCRPQHRHGQRANAIGELGVDQRCHPRGIARRGAECPRRRTGDDFHVAVTAATNLRHHIGAMLIMSEIRNGRHKGRSALEPLFRCYHPARAASRRRHARNAASPLEQVPCALSVSGWAVIPNISLARLARIPFGSPRKWSGV